MNPLPHVYTVSADSGHSGAIELRSNRLSSLLAEPPPEFGGAGKQWSPEGLLCAAVASCFSLMFRSVARTARLEWQDLECKVDGTLQLQDGILRFTHLVILARLAVDPRHDTAKYRRALEQAERDCLIANSLSASRELKVEIVSAMTTWPARVAASAG